VPGQIRPGKANLPGKLDRAGFTLEQDQVLAFECPAALHVSEADFPEFSTSKLEDDSLEREREINLEIDFPRL
jgi:hypothetical protein